VNIDQKIAKRETVTLRALIENHARKVHTPPEQVEAVQALQRGIAEWITDEPTLLALIIEDVARMIAQCQDGEELRDLSVQIRDLMLDYQPDASRVALTEDELAVLNQL